MGIELCKYLNRFSMMPYFHSGINFFKWLLLSSGFNFCSENDSVKIEGGEQKCSFCFFWVCVCVCHIRRGQWKEIQKPHNLTASAHGFFLGPAFPLLPSGGQQRASSPDRRLCHSVIIIYDRFLLKVGCAERVTVIIIWNELFPSPPQTVTLYHMSCSLPVHSKEIIDF